MLETFKSNDGVYLILARKQGLVLGVKGGIAPINNYLMLIHYKFLVLRDPKSKLQIPKTGELELALAFPGVPLLVQPNKEIALMGGVVAQPDDKSVLFTKEYRKTVITIIVSYILELSTLALTVDRDRVVSALSILYDEILKPQTNIISTEKIIAPPKKGN